MIDINLTEPMEPLEIVKYLDTTKASLEKKIRKLLNKNNFEDCISFNDNETVVIIDKIKFVVGEKPDETLVYFLTKPEQPVLFGTHADDLYNWFIRRYNEAKQDSFKRYLAPVNEDNIVVEILLTVIVLGIISALAYKAGLVHLLAKLSKVGF